MAKLNWTKEQKEEYFSENIRLVHSSIQQFRNMGYEYDDLFQMASIGFLKGLDTYDDEQGTKLSTYVVACMTKEVLYATRKDRAKCRNGGVVLSYEGEILGSDGRSMAGVENRCLEQTDLLHQHPIRMEEALEKKELVEEVLRVMKNYLTETEQKAIMMVASDVTQNEIAKSLGLSQANISKLIRLTRARILLHLRRQGYSFSEDL